MEFFRRHALDQLADPRIGGDVRVPAAPDEHFAKRKRGEEVPAGAAGDEERAPAQPPLPQLSASADWRGPSVTRASA